MAKSPIPNGEPETRTRFDWGIPKLTEDEDGDGDGESPNKKSGDGDTLNPRPWTCPRHISIYKNNTEHTFIVQFIIHKI